MHAPESISPADALARVMAAGLRAFWTKRDLFFRAPREALPLIRRAAATDLPDNRQAHGDDAVDDTR